MYLFELSELPLLWGRSVFLLRPSTDWMRPIYIMEDNLLYSASVDCNVSLIQKNTSVETSRIVFDQISGSCSLAKLTHKINHWASLVVQWLGVCLPMQGTQVQAQVWEDPTCCGATRPVRHNY